MHEISISFDSMKRKDTQGTMHFSFTFLFSQAISVADMIVVMANGLVKWFGTLEAFLATSYSRISKPDSSSPTSFTVSVKDKTPIVSCELKTDVILEDDSGVAYEEQNDQVEAEARKEGIASTSELFCVLECTTHR